MKPIDLLTYEGGSQSEADLEKYGLVDNSMEQRMRYSLARKLPYWFDTERALDALMPSFLIATGSGGAVEGLWASVKKVFK